MGQYSTSGKFAHDTACNVAESTRQAAQAAAANSPAGQVALNNAEIAWARACIASAKANNGGQGVECYLAVLKALGQNA